MHILEAIAELHANINDESNVEGLVRVEITVGGQNELIRQKKE